MFILKHVKTGTYYAGMNLGEDFRTDSSSHARWWLTEAAAARYCAKFGDRYVPVEV